MSISLPRIMEAFKVICSERKCTKLWASFLVEKQLTALIQEMKTIINLVLNMLLCLWWETLTLNQGEPQQCDKLDSVCKGVTFSPV